MRAVTIEVSGGVAEVTQCPPDVTVEIIDWDNCEECTDDCPDYCPEPGG